MRTRHLIGSIATAGAASAILLAPTASAEPSCTSAGAPGETGTSTTQCQSPGNVQITATAPDVPTYLYPWNDEFYGPALMIGGDEGGGGGGFGPHGGGGGGGGGRR